MDMIESSFVLSVICLGNYNGSISNYSIIYTNKINNFTLNYFISEQYNTHLIMKSSTGAKTPENDL